MHQSNRKDIVPMTMIPKILHNGFDATLQEINFWVKSTFHLFSKWKYILWTKYSCLKYGIIRVESWVFSDRVTIKLGLMLIEPTKQKLHSGRAKFQVGLVTSTKFLYGTNWKTAARITTICFTKVDQFYLGQLIISISV